MAEKPLIFISHIAEEAEVAHLFKDAIETSFLSMVDVFVSSDSASVSVGSNWLDRITEGLRTCKAILLLCSPASIKRPWINFEAGAGWARNVEIVPLCHSGIRPVDLPLPLNLLQGIEAHDEAKIQTVFGLIAKKLGSGTPQINAALLASKVAQFEQSYMIELKAFDGLLKVHKLWPKLILEMKIAGARMLTIQAVPDWQVNQIRTALAELQKERLLEFSFEVTNMQIGGIGSGAFGQLNIHISPDLNFVIQRRF